MAKVYVIQETSHDVLSAERWGEIVFLSVNGRDDFHNVADSAHNERLLAHLSIAIRQYTDEDWIVIAGSPYISAAVFWLAGHHGIRKLNILRWDNRDRRYIPLTLQLRRETVQHERRTEGTEPA